jgi:hypothetical protein
MKRKLLVLLVFTLFRLTMFAGEGSTALKSSESSLLSDAGIQVVEDNKANQIFIWEEKYPNGEIKPQFYSQKFNKQGDLIWKSPTPLTSSPNSQYSHQSISDGSGGVILVWEEQDLRSQETEIMAQRIDSAGNQLWGPTGRQLSKLKSNKITPLLISDGASGAIFVWSDSRNDPTGHNWDIYAQHLNGNGENLWNDHGLLISADRKDEFIGRLMLSDDRKVVIIWNKVVSNPLSGLEGYDFCYQKRSLDGILVQDVKFLSLAPSKENYKLAGDIVTDKSDGFFLGLIKSGLSLTPQIALHHIRINNEKLVLQDYFVNSDSLTNDFQYSSLELDANSSLIVNARTRRVSWADTVYSANALEITLSADSIVKEEREADNLVQAPDSLIDNHLSASISDLQPESVGGADSVHYLDPGLASSLAPSCTAPDPLTQRKNTSSEQDLFAMDQFSGKQPSGYSLSTPSVGASTYATSHFAVSPLGRSDVSQSLAFRSEHRKGPMNTLPDNGFNYLPQNAGAEIIASAWDNITLSQLILQLNAHSAVVVC